MKEPVPVALASKAAFDESHLHTYKRIARRLGFAPTRQMLDGLLPESLPLMSLRDDATAWKETRAAVHRRWPDIAEWTSKIADDGVKLDSVPERVVYDLLHQICPGDVEVRTHPWFKDLFRADFALVRGPATVFIEVLGMLQRGQEPHNSTAENYRRRTDQTLSIYAEHGVVPTLVYMDDICNPARVRAILREAIEQLQGVA